MLHTIISVGTRQKKEHNNDRRLPDNVAEFLFSKQNAFLSIHMYFCVI